MNLSNPKAKGKKDLATAGGGLVCTEENTGFHSLPQPSIQGVWTF
jgi:hypothetical protein